MVREHPFYKYLFLFGKGKNKVVLMGNEIANYWNDIYDLFWMKGKMIVQKLNGGDFTKKEIKKLFWDLCENMSKDETIIKLWIPILSKLEFQHMGDIYEIPSVKEQWEKLEESQIDVFVPALEKIRAGFYEMNLNWALEERHERELREITKGFKIRNIFGLEKKENYALKKYLQFFKKAKEDSEKWTLNLRHILDKNKARKGGLQKVYGILCNSSVKGSTHEGQEINLGKELRDYTNEERKFCEKTIKLYLQSLINKTNLNKNG